MKGLEERFASLEGLEANADADEETLRKASNANSQDFELGFVRLMTPMQFNQFLKYSGVDLAVFDVGNTRSLRDLWLELVWQTTSFEKVPDPAAPNGVFRIRRLVKLLVVELQAEIDGVNRFLVMNSEGQRKNLNHRLTAKLFCDEEELEGLGRMMMQNFSLAEADTFNLLEIVESLQHDEERDSAAYPGLKTIYDMRTIKMRVSDPSAPALTKLGLPSGNEFEKEKSGGFAASRTRVWAWVEPKLFESHKRQSTGTMLGESRKSQLNLERLNTLQIANASLQAQASPSDHGDESE